MTAPSDTSAAPDETARRLWEALELRLQAHRLQSRAGLLLARAELIEATVRKEGHR